MTLEWTGERFLPSISGPIALEHIHRYIIAREFVQNKHILDIACGEGYGANFLAETAEQVFGVDISSPVIDFAKNKYKKPNLEFKVGSCSNIPLPDHSIDVVVSFETIEHHDEHEKMMTEIQRVLRPDGLLIISSPDKHEHTDIPKHNNPFHIKELYKDELETLLNTYFARHFLLGQRVIYGSNIATLQKDIAKEYITYSGDVQNVSKNQGVNRPLYFIAIASNGELPTIDNSFFESMHMDLHEKDNFISSLTISLYDKEQRLNDYALLVQNKEQQLNDFSLLVQNKEQQLSDFDQQVQNNKQQLDNFTLLLQDKEQQLSHQFSLLQSHEATIARLNHDIANLYASNSWRITAPLRSLRHLLRRVNLKKMLPF